MAAWAITPGADPFSTPLAASRKSAEEPEQIYFAYGSNLNLTQMASRCPESVFLGTATLPAYRWQINERGVANVVKSSRDCFVEGLVYIVNPKDKKSLDRSEGVSMGFYEDQRIMVDFEPDKRYTSVKTAELAGPIRKQGFLPLQSAQKGKLPGARPVEALVYVSTAYTSDGVIRDEYIGRMRDAVSDALDFGVSPFFINKFIAPHLGEGNAERAVQNQPVRGFQASEKAKVVDETYEMTRGRSRTPRGDYAPANSVNLREIKQENREPHRGSGVLLPQRLLDVITALVSGVPTNGDVIYAVAKEDPTVASHFSVAAVTRDLELATELTMRYFRYSYSRWLSQTVEKLGHPVGQNSGGTEVGVVEWDLENDRYLRLSATTPAGDSRVAVWVEAQVVTEST